jgi:hypothetical protein
MKMEVSDMNAKLLFAGSLAALLLGAQAASAQTNLPSPAPVVPASVEAPVGAPSTFGYGANSFATSYEGSFAEGLGAMMAGAGQYNLNSSRALVYLEQARAKNIENYRNAIETRYAIKRANDEYRATKFEQEQMTPEMRTRISLAKLPDRLSAAEYNSRTGQLNWPAVLEAPEFDADRAAIDAAFAQRQAEDVGVTSVFYREVSQRCQRMHSIMLSRIDRLSTTDSIAARTFLSSLEHEARHIPEAALALVGR